MKEDYFEQVLQCGLVARSTMEFDQIARQEEVLILDLRSEKEFVKGFIPNSVFLGMGEQLVFWITILVPNQNQPILLVVPEGREAEAVTRLAQMGYNNCLGYLSGGFNTWKKADNTCTTFKEISAVQFAIMQEDTPVIDVRRRSEFKAEHVVGAQNMPLELLHQRMELLERYSTYLVHCAEGYRSVIAMSLLNARGFHHLFNVEGGFKAIKDCGKVSIIEG